MMNLMEYLIEQCSMQVNEAFKQEDFGRACELIGRVVRKDGYGVYPGMVPMNIGGKNAASIFAINPKNNTAVSIDFFEGGDAMSPDAITVIDGGRELLRNITADDGKASSKGKHYACPGVGITAILKVVVKILKDGSKYADAAFEQYSEYFSVLEGFNDKFDLNLIIESRNFNDEEVQAKIDKMKAIGKSDTQILSVLYRLCKDAEKAGETAFYEKWAPIRDEYAIKVKGKPIGGGRGSVSTASTGAPVQRVRIPVAKEVTLKQIKAGQTKATAEFWAGQGIRQSSVERMKRFRRQVAVFVQKQECQFALFAGAPGVGKSYIVEEEMINYLGDPGTTGWDKQWTVIKGATSPAQFYKTLFLFRRPNNVILIDDGDTFLKDPQAADLFKAATDSKKYRLVSWNKGGKGEALDDIESSDYQSYCELLEMDPKCKVVSGELPLLKKAGTGPAVYGYPKSFVFQGRIIIVTNNGFSFFEDAIVDRADVKADLDFTDKELLDIVRDIAPHLKGPNGGDIRKECKNYALNWIDEQLDKIAVFNAGKEEWEKARLTVSIRTFQKVAATVDTYWDNPSDRELMHLEMMEHFKSKAGGAAHK